MYGGNAAQGVGQDERFLDEARSELARNTGLKFEEDIVTSETERPDAPHEGLQF